MVLTEQELAMRPLDMKEACEFLKIGKTTMTKLLTTGEIKGKKVGGQWRIQMKDLLAYLDEPDTTAGK